ncbi:metal ABC transporter substrate-binding protein [Solibacillus sp. FSL W7-1436]|uniref:metal ABC transporter substrate-binding protein n=1 Tax=unclassified Solibacillus TaxID=2637870 RepID=UPI0030FC3F8E
MRKQLFVLVLILFFLVGCSQQEMTKVIDSKDNETGKNGSDLITLQLEIIAKNGYPKNENGQTYGPDLKDLIRGELGEPDLILAVGENDTIGYVKKVDLERSQPKTPEEAVKLNDAPPREVPLYDVDGETVIGKFIIR